MIRVFAPASVSNVGPGFDVLGFALHRPGDTVEVEAADTPGITLESISGDEGALPTHPAGNAAAVAADAVLRAARTLASEGAGATLVVPAGLRMRLHKGLPPQSGLGSSGASAAAGAAATNELLGRPFTPEQLVGPAMEAERAICGSAHADNVAPALMGGFVLIRSYTPLEIVRLPVPDGLFVAVVHPHCRVSTRQARGLLFGRSFALPDIVRNTGNVAALVAALHQSNLPLLGRCIEDRLVEPVRARLIPGFEEARTAALGAGALGCSISGSGPTLFAFADREDLAARVAQAMRGAFRRAAGLESDAWTGSVAARGARPID